MTSGSLATSGDFKPVRPRRERTGYGVKLVRGPFVRLAPHQDTHDDEKAFLAWTRQLRRRGERLAADLFSGAGGLSLGLTQAGWRVVLGVDHDKEAVETHRHHFGGFTTDWDLSDRSRVERIAHLISKAGVELLAGAPPCQPFSKAGRSLIRQLVREGMRDPRDERRELWRAFLEIIRLARPRAVVMENVPDMALDREMFILRTMVHELEAMGYAVEERVVNTWQYGVPQFRQRLILVALAKRTNFVWPQEVPGKVTVWNAISDLPPVEGGWRPAGGAEGWAPYDGPKTSFQVAMRGGTPGPDAGKVFDHITRPVREDDARAFEMMDTGTRYSDLPEDVKRYRDDIFDDKYKRLDENGLSRTITAHIAKDGYWYIHPQQNRTLTVREAARLQTFPDHFRFAGPPSAAFRQIGNAVPPVLGRQLGDAIMICLLAAQPAPATTTQVAAELSAWFTGLSRLSLPWLRAETRWQALSAEMMLDRAEPRQARHLWQLLARWPQPEDIKTAELLEIGRWVGREARSRQVVKVAEWLVDHPGQLDDDEKARRIPNVSESVKDLAVLAVPTQGKDAAEEPVLVTKGVLRVVARFTGDPVDRFNRLTDGRLGVARMIGDGDDARTAHLGLIELANTLCRPGDDPLCFHCPLALRCKESKADQQRASHLPFST
jgi:DNA (cytosine-5)-methyltransferase 1